MSRLLLAVLLASIPMALADYYADITIDVDESGLARIKGSTNHPLLAEGSNYQASQAGSRMLLNISPAGNFSVFAYELKLPKSTRINYMRVPTITRIENSPDGLVIAGIGESRDFSIIVQYQADESYAFLFLITGLILALAAAVSYAYYASKRKKPYRKESLTERQLMIMKIVTRRGHVTQAELEKLTRLPKSSLSRNIDSLIRKEMLIKEERGMTNVLYRK